MSNRPSKRVRELIRQGAETLVDIPRERLDELHKVTLESEYMRTIGSDPALDAAIRRGNRSNLLHWAAANISHPGEPVPANTREPVAIARGIVRRGLNSPTSVDAYRLGQNVAWRLWMQIAFELTSDPGELRELLEVSAHSMASFVDATVVEVYRQLEIERDKLTRETHTERLQTITQLLNGEPVRRQLAESRLGYRLGQDHAAAVIWGDESIVDPADLERGVEVLRPAGDRAQLLSVPVGSGTRWVWLSGTGIPESASVTAALGRLPGVRVALGAPAPGIEGFRRSHHDAITTQRMMMRLDLPEQFVAFADVELMALITSEPEKADRFIKHTLGAFESADPDLQLTVLAFIHEQCNGSRAAARLFTHRNTVLRKVARADQLLPRPLADSSVNVAVALEALRWRAADV